MLAHDHFTSRLTESKLGPINLEGKDMGFSSKLYDFVSLSTKFCFILNTLNTFYNFPSAKPDRIIL